MRACVCCLLITFLHNKCTINEVSTRTWAVSLDPWPNRTWGCAHFCFSVLRMDVASISSHRHRYGGITRGNNVIDIVRFTDIHRSIYICQLANKIKGKKSRIFRNWVPKELPFVCTSTCNRGKTHILLDLFTKNTECTRGNNSPRARRLTTFRSECKRYGSRAYII